MIKEHILLAKCNALDAVLISVIAEYKTNIPSQFFFVCKIYLMLSEQAAMHFSLVCKCPPAMQNYKHVCKVIFEIVKRELIN